MLRHYWDYGTVETETFKSWLVLSLLFANVKIFSKKIQPCVCNIPAFHQLTSFSFQLNFRNATLNFAHSRAAKMLDRVLLHFRQVRGRAPAASWPAARPRSWKMSLNFHSVFNGSMSHRSKFFLLQTFFNVLPCVHSKKNLFGPKHFFNDLFFLNMRWGPYIKYVGKGKG